MQVGALPVFHDLMNEHIAVLWSLDPAGKFTQANLSGRLVTAFSSNDVVNVFILNEADRDGLEDADATHRIQQLLLPNRVQGFAGLFGVRTNPFDLDEEGTGQT